MEAHELKADAEKYATVHCDTHGDRHQAFVCGHLVHEIGQGFHCSEEEPTNPHPDAWCSRCEQIRVNHGGDWNEESESLITVKLVCGDCYEGIKMRNIVRTSDTLI